jgi:hypothetical protein
VSEPLSFAVACSHRMRRLGPSLIFINSFHLSNLHVCCQNLSFSWKRRGSSRAPINVLAVLIACRIKTRRMGYLVHTLRGPQHVDDKLFSRFRGRKIGSGYLDQGIRLSAWHSLVGGVAECLVCYVQIQR